MTISAVIDTPKASTVSSTSKVATDSVQADQDKFMKLLVTQLKNQDPLNPMDNAAMTSQLAQLSTVTGINKVNATLESLRTDQANAQSLNATNLIGKGVLVAGKGIELSSSTDSSGKTTSSSVFGVDLASAAESVTVSIQDGAGASVRTLTLKSSEVGTYPITWDGTTDAGGKAAAGKYSFSVKAVSGGKTLSDATALQLASVASVSTGSGGVKLNTSLGQFAMSAVKEVL